jgi:hypothetical protein
MFVTCTVTPRSKIKPQQTKRSLIQIRFPSYRSRFGSHATGQRAYDIVTVLSYWSWLSFLLMVFRGGRFGLLFPVFPSVPPPHLLTPVHGHATSPPSVCVRVCVCICVRLCARRVSRVFPVETNRLRGVVRTPNQETIPAPVSIYPS